ncbi:hypothetical protein KKF61_01825 [Patescibacteria group bacterium]|nr:hypothetical protein [Patescibacteria group bacterium]MBU0964564.1 hypothetical protein [Patescibacteria group bacterium]
MTKKLIIITLAVMIVGGGIFGILGIKKAQAINKPLIGVECYDLCIEYDLDNNCVEWVENCIEYNAQSSQDPNVR